MATYPPPEITTNEELYAWNAIVRAWDQFSDTNPDLWPLKKKQFINGLKQQLVVNSQGEVFFKVANIVIRKLEPIK